MYEDKPRFAKLLMDPESIGTVLLCGLIDEFGTECFEWEPETLNIEILHAWKVTPPQVTMDKIQALLTVLTTNTFYKNLDAFNHVCNALAGDGADFENYDPASISQIAWAIAETTLVSPPEEKDSSYQFGDEIITFITAKLDEEGFSKPPRILANLVKPKDNTTEINDILTGDGIEFNGYWDMQQRKRLDVDEWIGSRLLKLMTDLSDLKLTHADPKAIQALRDRASKALAAQRRETQSESESVAKTPSL